MVKCNLYSSHKLSPRFVKGTPSVIMQTTSAMSEMNVLLNIDPSYHLLVYQWQFTDKTTSEEKK